MFGFTNWIAIPSRHLAAVSSVAACSQYVAQNKIRYDSRSISEQLISKWSVASKQLFTSTLIALNRKRCWHGGNHEIFWVFRYFENNFILNYLSRPQYQIIFWKSEEFLDYYIEEMKRIKDYLIVCVKEVFNI